MINAPANIAVVGGGVVGCTVAFRLAQAGCRVTLIERHPWGSHASGKNAGNLNPLFLTPPPLLPLALESFELHTTLAKELASLGCPLHALTPVRRLLLAFNATETAKIETVTQHFKGRPAFSTSLLDRQQLQHLEPRLTEKVQSGLLLEGNLSIDGRAITTALAEGAARLGTRLARANVEHLHSEADRVTAVETENEIIPCDAVVLATGAWVAETERWLGIPISVAPVKGQMLRVKMPGQGLRFDLTHNSVSLYRRREKEAWVGVTHEDAGMDETPSSSARDFLLQEAIRILPEMADATVLEHTAALRPTTPSGLPIAGKAAHWDNVFLANGGGAKGLLLCTGIARAILDSMRSDHSAVFSFPKS